METLESDISGSRPQGKVLSKKFCPQNGQLGNLDFSFVADVKKAVKIPVLVGSGVTVENVHNYMMVNAMIIGSHFKKSGSWENELDVDRIVRFMDRVTGLRELNDD
jgi:predicted TIM-barrel enzyme